MPILIFDTSLPPISGFAFKPVSEYTIPLSVIVAPPLVVIFPANVAVVVVIVVAAVVLRVAVVDNCVVAVFVTTAGL